jgi:hypothetical protein
MGSATRPVQSLLAKKTSVGEIQQRELAINTSRAGKMLIGHSITAVVTLQGAGIVDQDGISGDNILAHFYQNKGRQRNRVLLSFYCFKETKLEIHVC